MTLARAEPEIAGGAGGTKIGWVGAAAVCYCHDVVGVAGCAFAVWPSDLASVAVALEDEEANGGPVAGVLGLGHQGCSSPDWRAR